MDRIAAIEYFLENKKYLTESTFYCDYHGRQEDSDRVGFNTLPDGRDVCDDAMDEMADEEEQAAADQSSGDEPKKEKTKTANKAKKKAAGFTRGALDQLDGDKPRVGDKDWWRGGHDEKRLSLARNAQRTFMSPERRDATLRHQTNVQRKAGGPPDAAQASNYQYQGVDATGAQKSSPVPANVQTAASKYRGGKVVFGRYYDAKGNYLGRTSGGEWIDAASDPNAKSQLEIVNKLQELQNRLHEYNKDSLKNEIRKIYNECGYR